MRGGVSDETLSPSYVPHKLLYGLKIQGQRDFGNGYHLPVSVSGMQKSGTTIE